VSRGCRASLCGVCALLIGTGAITPVRGTSAAVLDSSPSLAGWTLAPAFVPILTAEQSHPGSYHVYVSPRGIDDVIRDLGPDSTIVKGPGSWEPNALLPLDAFGLDGIGDRQRLARLYGARRPRVARGPRVAEDGGHESWTLVSPYPDAMLRTLEPGTLLIVLRLP
jgi:hypothetical protein